MSKTRSYAQIIIGSWLFLTAMAIYLSLRVAPLDFQQGGNYRILYVHVPAARMSILVYIATAINTLLFLLTKHPFFLRSSGTGIEMGAFFTLLTLVTGGFRGIPMWGTFWVWDARLTSVFILFIIYPGALCFQKLPVEPASISIRVGPIDIPIIKSSVNWWNTSHQPGSISRYINTCSYAHPNPVSLCELPLLKPYIVRFGNTSSYSIFSRISFNGRNRATKLSRRRDRRIELWGNYVGRSCVFSHAAILSLLLRHLSNIKSSPKIPDRMSRKCTRIWLGFMQLLAELLKLG